MNQIILIGNLTRDPEKHTTQKGETFTTFTLAVSRRYKDANGNYPADFISCTAWRQTGEYVANYGAKGRKVAVVGELQSRQYEKDGQKRTVFDVVCSSAEYVDKKPTEQSGAQAGEFVEVQDSDLPF